MTKFSQDIAKWRGIRRELARLTIENAKLKEENAGLKESVRALKRQLAEAMEFVTVSFVTGES